MKHTEKEVWYSGAVQQGDQYGRTLGFPTANLDAKILAHIDKEGVYAAKVKAEGIEYLGALYLGPRLVLGETRRVLEINLLDFSGDLYGKTLSFQLGAFIRKPSDFVSTEALIRQLQDDIAAVRHAA